MTAWEYHHSFTQIDELAAGQERAHDGFGERERGGHLRVRQSRVSHGVEVVHADAAAVVELLLVRV